MKKTPKKIVKKKPIVVDRKFLMQLADDIFNPRTQKFLRLCDGVLQNGPDPTNPKRPMHCGLGELYFAMTGRQPTAVGEADVVNMAVEKSTINDSTSRAHDEACCRARDAIDKLDVPEEMKDNLYDAVDNTDTYNCDEDNFRQILDEIPGSNDDCKGDACSIADYRNRSKRVAEHLREAAALLPA